MELEINHKKIKFQIPIIEVFENEVHKKIDEAHTTKKVSLKIPPLFLRGGADRRRGQKSNCLNTLRYFYHILKFE